MIRFFASTIFVLFVSAGLSVEVKAAPNCSVPTIRTLNDQTVNGTMTVRTGKRCSIIMRSSRGPTYSTSIVAHPSHGGVRVSGNSVIYQPRQGFVGNDAFTYARIGFDTRNNKIRRTVSIAVEVTP